MITVPVAYPPNKAALSGPIANVRVRTVRVGVFMVCSLNEA